MLQVRAWPGEQFIIKLTAKDQFSQPTVANARFYFNNPTLVKKISINVVQTQKLIKLVHMQDNNMLVRFNPQFVVIDSGDSGQNIMTINNIFQVTYSISSGGALTTDMPLGSVTIDDPTLNTLV